MTSLHFQTYFLQLTQETSVKASLPKQVFDSPTEISNQILPLFKDLDREYFVAVALNARYQPIGANTVSIGTLSASLVYLREVFKFAIPTNTSRLILAHNNPSGELSLNKNNLDFNSAVGTDRVNYGHRNT